jgi:sortase A
VRVAVRTAGELLVTFAALVLLFIVYQLYYTNVVGRQAMDDEAAALQKQWALVTPISPAAVAPTTAPGGHATVAPTSDPSNVPAPPIPVFGDGVAILHIPRLGSGSVTVGTPVLEGIRSEVLDKAAGHYPGSALPGQLGNFAIAGQRKTHGEPFLHLDEMRAGDYIVAETAGAWYVYRVDRDPFVVQQTDMHVVFSVPDQPGAAPTQGLITLTTCDSWWSSTQRLIVVGHLVATQLRSVGPPSMLS